MQDISLQQKGSTEHLLNKQKQKQHGSYVWGQAYALCEPHKSQVTGAKGWGLPVDMAHVSRVI